MTGVMRKSARGKTRAANEEDQGVQNAKKPPVRVSKEKRRDGNLIGALGFNLKIFVGMGIVASVVIVVLVNSVMKPAVSGGGNLRAVTPFPAPKLMDLPQVCFF